MCIDDEFQPNMGGYHPKMLDIVTVIDSDEENGKIFYDLAEYPPLRNFAYSYEQSAFIPLQNQNEVELLQEARCSDGNDGLFSEEVWVRELMQKGVELINSSD